MLTRRGFWILAGFSVILAMGMLLSRRGAALFGVAGILWVGFEGLLVWIRIHFALKGIRIQRFLDGQPVGGSAIVARRKLSLRIVVSLDSAVNLPAIELIDRPPTLGDTEGVVQFRGGLRRGFPVTFEGHFVAPCAGKVRFEGIRVELGDAQGFFHYSAFVRQPVEIVVLPRLEDNETVRPASKRMNLLPMQGLHRHLKAGTGSELLDLRDYLPGDPPKMIAWKISARRDRLIAREYESEVPIRCTMFVDATAPMKLGEPGLTMFDRMSAIAAAFASRAVGGRDPVGLCLVGDRGATVLQPAPAQRHLMRIYSQLSHAAADPGPPTDCASEPVVEAAWQFCNEVYPELISPTRNSPGPWYSRLPPVMIPGTLYFALFVAATFGSLTALVVHREENFSRVAGLLAILGVVGFVGATLVRRLGLDRSKMNWRHRPKRKQLAAVLAARGGLGPGVVGAVSDDDRSLSHALQVFLAEHRVPYYRPLFAPNGRYLYDDRLKAERLAKLLTRAVAHARDNELYILMADLSEAMDSWPSLLRAIQVARARRHQVVFVYPWPAGTPFPGSPAWNNDPLAGADPLKLAAIMPLQLLHQMDAARMRRVYDRLSEELGRVGVPLLCAGSRDVVSSLLDRLERMRLQRV